MGNLCLKKELNLKKNIVGFGHPLLDLIKVTDGSVLENYGIERGSANLAKPEQLEIFTDLLNSDDTQFIPGGSGLNSLRVMKWIDKNNQTNVSFAGCVGKDKFAEQLRLELAKTNLNVFLEVDKTQPTGTCAVFIQDQDRTMLANLGAALALSYEYLNTSLIKAVLDEADSIYCEGFFFNVSALPIYHIELREICAKKNKALIWNLSATYLPYLFTDEWWSMFPYMDVIIGNTSEATCFAEKFNFKRNTIEDIAMEFVNIPKVNQMRGRIVIITSAEKDTLVATKDRGVIYFPTIPIETSEIVDTNGAGDSFVGGFVYSYTLNKSLEECIDAGHKAAHAVLKCKGCNLSGPPPNL